MNARTPTQASRAPAGGQTPAADSTHARSPQTVAEQVRSIIYPSSYDKISRAREVLQDARVASTHVGMQLAQADRRQLAVKRTQLNELFSRQSRETLSSSDYSEFLEGYMITHDAYGGLAVLTAMRQHGQKATLAQYNMVLKTAAQDFNARAIYEIGEEMRIAGLLLSLSKRGQPELAYSVYMEMQTRNVAVQRNACHELICALGAIGEVDLAFSVLRAAMAAALAFDQTTSLALLRAAGAALHHDAYRHSFEQLTQVFGSSLAEGDYILGLQVAARHGDVSLATSIIRAMQGHGYAMQEHHLEPLFEALVQKTQWLPALRVLETMRSAGHGAEPATVRCLMRKLQGAKAEELTEHVFSLLASHSAELPHAISTATLNALVGALAKSRCVEAALDRLDRGASARATRLQQEVLFARLLDEDRLVPSQRAYEAMLGTCLTQYVYEDAFVYLESMKAHGMVPGWKTYSKIVRRCARVADPRAHTAMQEMRDLGYAAARRKPSKSDKDSEPLSTPDPSTKVPDLETLLGDSLFKV
ncbi:hypothetical protein DL89DRAFT_290989 [Linderina pennispora]|uniref:Pentatricopeptide repeat-containing protein-mitochondrial domain-containing protein n=1 Tax=Linderina pennispora TaxID=61395 RepID=A0A1Y1WJJ2_9FUNG|nr:uncharacterized protein DL89DRAFT_290989 [Linderina pennispora]ORX73274.1 hypothetical protein DL89DRAFT_290989 [Linderina pennispora]